MSVSFVVDASVLVAVLNSEPEADGLARTLATSEFQLGAPTMLELHIWVARNLNATKTRFVDFLLTSPRVTIVPFDRDLELIAADAFSRFGKGRHHAKLNYGDCMAYAVARAGGLPLLFKGEDFRHTDVEAHPASVF